MCESQEKPYTGAMFVQQSMFHPAEPQPRCTQDSWGVCSWVYAKALGRLPRAVKRYRLAGYNFPEPDKFYLSFYLRIRQGYFNKHPSPADLPY